MLPRKLRTHRRRQGTDVTTAELVHLRPAGVERAHGVPSITLATLLFIGAELMFFAGLTSAHTIGKTMFPIWPPPDLPRLPVESTAFNTLVLLLSGVLVTVGGRKAERGEHAAAWRPLAIAFALGVAFVGLQGVEWVRMLGQGLTLQSSSYGGFFYLIVGAHGLHVLGGLVAFGFALRGVARADIDRDAMLATRLFWLFVVLLWPVLYWRVYL